MAAVIDLFVCTDSWVGFDVIYQHIHALGFELQSDDIEVIDDWMYTNFQKLDNQTESSVLKEYVESGKIIVLTFAINSLWHGGCHISRNTDSLFEYDLWLNTKNLSHVEEEKITPANEAFYEAVTSAVMQHVNAGILLAGIGLEKDIIYHHDPIATISAYSRSDMGRWIVPKVIQRDFAHYRKEERGGFTIYTHV